MVNTVPDTQRVDSFLPMPGAVHPSLHPDSWAHWVGMMNSGHVVMPVLRLPLVATYDASEPLTAADGSPPTVIFTLRKIAASLDARFGSWWWWCWWADDGRYVASPFANWYAREPQSSLWGTGLPLL